MQRNWKVAGLGLVGVLVLGAAAALAGPRAPGGIEEIGLKAYWSLLTDGQKEQAKAIAVDYLADTAPDRLGGQARLIRFKADVAAALTKEQRIEAGRMGWIAKNLTQEKRRENFAQFLEATDREALAARVEKLAAATPQQRVAIGVEILDQLWNAAEPTVAAKLSLVEEQRRQIRALADGVKTDLLPVAMRIATAKETAKQNCLALLDAEQRRKLDAFRDGAIAKVLAFIRARK